MEYVRGEDLRRVYNQEVSRGRAMPAEPAAHILMGAAAGLDYAHRQTSIDGRPLGIVHRDISPQNLIVTYDGHVKIVDFGVAKATGKMTETRTGVLKGKYSYMSPEQASGDSRRCTHGHLRARHHAVRSDDRRAPLQARQRDRNAPRGHRVQGDAALGDRSGV